MYLDFHFQDVDQSLFIRSADWDGQATLEAGDKTVGKIF